MIPEPLLAPLAALVAFSWVSGFALMSLGAASSVLPYSWKQSLAFARPRLAATIGTMLVALGGFVNALVSGYILSG